MTYGGYSYIDLDYQPDPKNDFVVLFWFRSKLSAEKTAEAIASESSVGSWTKLKTMNQFVWDHYRARVFWIKKVGRDGGFAKIAYPLEHFDGKNIAQFAASVLGNIFGLKELKELYVMDISFPINYQKKYFKGPVKGLEGIRKMVGTNKKPRPHIGTIVKPKVGLAPKEFAKVAYDSYVGGLDLVKDDENLVDQDFCKWKDRLHEMVKVIEKAEKETGMHKLYSSNVSDSFSRAIERIDYLKDHGLQKNILVMIDVYIAGLPMLSELLNETRKYKFAVHAHRAGYAAHDRGSFGINFQVYEKFYRLMGVDQLHIGTGVGKMEGNPMRIFHHHMVAHDFEIKEALRYGALSMKFADHIKPILSIASGGLDAGMVEAVVELFGYDVNIQAGAGVHGHPDGTFSGAKSMRQAIDAILEGVSLKEYAKTHKELAKALKKWGYYDPKKIREVKELDKKYGKKLDKLAVHLGRKFIDMDMKHKIRLVKKLL